MPFEVHTDASDYAIGGVLAQEGHPLAFSSRKLNDVDQRIGFLQKNEYEIAEHLPKCEWRSMDWSSGSVRLEFRHRPRCAKRPKSKRKAFSTLPKERKRVFGCRALKTKGDFQGSKNDRRRIPRKLDNEICPVIALPNHSSMKGRNASGPPRKVNWVGKVDVIEGEITISIISGQLRYARSLGNE
ncbi:polyprotein [Cucumis melo var. makuwa]|uniref:Polyprotein n=1 Tax=Cucumis melo var. makuwa TaxID=1194695 RepID=A0A5A7SR83_CUCMM|nr:polyprotein [Cucumis melo var. makuwa]